MHLDKFAYMNYNIGDLLMEGGCAKMSKIVFSKDVMKGIMNDLCDDYNKQKPIENTTDKIYKAVILIALCELTNLYQIQFGEEASEDPAS